MHNFISAILLTIIAWLPSLAASPTAAPATDIFARFEQRFDVLDSVIMRPGCTATAPIAPVAELDGFSERPWAADSAAASAAIDALTQARLDEMKSQTGLTANGQVYWRLDDGFGLEEEDALSRYKGKVQAEVRWHFLQSSAFNRRGKAEEIRLKGAIDQLGIKREMTGRLVALQLESFRERYDSLLTGVLAHRLTNLELLAQAQDYLLQSGAIASDELLNILDQKAEAERLMASIGGDSSAELAANLSNPGAQILRLDTPRLLAYIIDNNTEADALELRKRLLDQQAANTKYLSTLNLSPFLRYSYYVRPDAGNSSNIDAGVNFIIPLTSETAKKRKAIKAERLVADLEHSDLTARITERVTLAATDIDRLNRSIEGEVRRLAALRGYLDRRKMAYDNRIGEYNYLSRMKEYNSYLQCCERLLGFTYQRDCHLASLQNYLGDLSILNFCEATDIDINSTQIPQDEKF